MKVSNTKISVLAAVGMAVKRMEAELEKRTMPVPEYQFKNPFGESVFKWKTTRGVGAWWITVAPLGDDQFAVLAANPDPARMCGDRVVAGRSRLADAVEGLMSDILKREEEEA